MARPRKPPPRTPPPTLAGRIRTLALLALLALSASAAALLAWRDYEAFASRPLPLSAPLTVDFPAGGNLEVLLRRLEAEGLAVGADWRWRLLARQLGVEKRLKAGEYRFDARMTPAMLLDAVAAGRVLMHQLRFEPGLRFADLRARVEAHPVLAQTLTGADEATLLSAIGADRQQAEGLFLPETYFFPRGYTDRELYRRAYFALQQVLLEAWETRAPDLPLADPYEALILASIIEKETGQAFERPLIAGVFIRRLKLGMRLQTDPTVIYGLGDAFDGDLRKRDLTTDTPFNTYTRHGLPPTPIALPSAAAIRAALNPEPGRALYFVARGDGTHQFSETLAEHNAAVRRYQLQGR